MLSPSPTRRRSTVGGSAGGVIKNGAGTLNLTGNSTYTGQTTINDGLLINDGALTSDVVVMAGGIYGGDGGSAGLHIASGDTVAPVISSAP